MPNLRQILCLFALMICASQWLHAQESVLVEYIIVTGNQRTREHVILREVKVKTGDSIALAEIEAIKSEAIKTLTQTQLFNFVDIEHIFIDSTRLHLHINVRERWYIWPGVVFSLAETNLNSWWQNKDFERINYGFFVQDMNFRGRKEKLTINFQYGWKRRIGLNYQVPGLNKKRTMGAGIELFYANNREINYASVNNERLFQKWDHFVQEEITIGGKFEYRPRYYNINRFNVGINTVIINDSVKQIAPNYLPSGLSRSQHFYFSYGFKREKRDNIGYPLTGYVFDSSLDQDGIGVLNENDIIMTKALVTLNTHHHLSGRWFFANGIKGKWTIFNPRNVPYYFQRGLGYGNAFIRGYELEVIDGQHYILYKSNFKYQIIEKKVVDLNFGSFDKFDKFHYSLFLNAFGDAGYVQDNINAAVNPLANTWQYAYGLGLDFVTYYDLVIRFEGSINQQGRPGFYIHFKNPI